jgi:hypothetical protein
LGYPRLLFSGSFRTNLNQKNNDRCNYLYPEFYKGNNHFEFFDAHVTSAVYEDGSAGADDTVVGQGVFSSPRAKFTDLDVDCQNASTIYGLSMGIERHGDRSPPAFTGKWTPNIIAQYMWPRYKQFKGGKESGLTPFSAQSTSVITELKFLDIGDSIILRQLKEQAVGGKLSVRITMHYHARRYPPYNSFNGTSGTFTATIGIPSRDDTLNVPGERSMFPTDTVPADKAMNTAPFEVDYTRHEVRIDLSNSLPTKSDNSIKDIGVLRLGALVESVPCVQLLGDERGIPYTDTSSGGIFKIAFDPSQHQTLSSSALVIAEESGTGGSRIKVCGESSSTGKHKALVLLRESTYFMRPRGYYAGRLQSLGDISRQEFYVTKYGKPVSHEAVKIIPGESVIPPNGVKPVQQTKTTSADGIAVFDFTVAADIPENRTYRDSGCYDAAGKPINTLPIDGQVYFFTFCVDSSCKDQGITLSFRAFSDVTPPPIPSWEEDVEPILKHYVGMIPMGLGTYESVTERRNLQRLKSSLGVPIDHPEHVPATRDLSPKKRKIITDFLNNPISLTTVAQVDDDQIPLNRCDPNVLLSFSDNPVKTDPFLYNLTHNLPPDYILDEPGLLRVGERVVRLPKRPLTGELKLVQDSSSKLKLTITKNCSTSGIAKQLHQAMALEWATIPTYLTGYFSIKMNGSGPAIRTHIYQIAEQEMQHMTYVGNMLIAMHEHPVINITVAPHFPTKLPGDVLPDLTVHARKLSKAQVHEVYMGIEVPADTSVAGDLTHDFTIGGFYEDIIDCINAHPGDLFDPNTTSDQISGKYITDKISALAAIDVIISQGEGASPSDPYYDGNHEHYAHFFQFEEMFCGRELMPYDNYTHYSYNGSSIYFPTGDALYPIREDFSYAEAQQTNCNDAATTFRNTYIQLLDELEQSFNGSPSMINTAIGTMFTLQGNGNALVAIPISGASDNCGPVWD